MIMVIIISSRVWKRQKRASERGVRGRWIGGGGHAIHHATTKRAGGRGGYRKSRGEHQTLRGRERELWLLLLLYSLLQFSFPPSTLLLLPPPSKEWDPDELSPRYIINVLRCIYRIQIHCTIYTVNNMKKSTFVSMYECECDLAFLYVSLCLSLYIYTYIYNLKY